MESYEVKKLEDKLAVLKSENAVLKEELNELVDYTNECDHLERIFGQSRPRGSFFGKMRNLPDFKEKWHDTAFWKFHSEIDRIRFITLDMIDKTIRNYIEYSATQPFGIMPFNILAYCEMAIPTECGPLFHLIDPFGEIDMIVATINNEDYRKYVGKISVFSCTVKPNTDGLQVIKTERLPYTLTDKLA